MAWFAKATGAYARTSNQAISNARMIAEMLTNLGWSINAVCGVLGNIGWEGGYNPWRWQSDDVISINDTASIQTQSGHAYGLFQFDPAGQYVYNVTAQGYSGWGPNFSDFAGNVNDGNAQVLYVHNDLGGGYIQTSAYPLSYSQFKVSTLAADYLAMAWLRNFERGVGHETDRQSEAIYWWNYFQANPIGKTRRKMPWIYYLKHRRY